MKNVKREFEKYCRNTQKDFSVSDSIKSYNNSTLFCPAGMQQYANLFEMKWVYGTSANIQACLRAKDLDEIKDGSHLLYFNMLGLFSFRDMSMKRAMDWWVSFLEEYLDLKIDKVTIHPKMLRDWLPFIDEYIPVETDNDCVWSDGNTSGYCMEFYVNGVEVGNIVNTEGDCIDAGFGLERLQDICNGTKPDKDEALRGAIGKIIELGVKPSPEKQGYVLRRLLNMAVKSGLVIDHPYYEEEKARIAKMKEFYEKNKSKFSDKPKSWWKETHGVDIDLIPKVIK